MSWYTKLRKCTAIIVLFVISFTRDESHLVESIEQIPASTTDRPWLQGTPSALPFISKTRISHDTHIYNFGLPCDDQSAQSTKTLGIDVCSCLLVSPPHNKTLIRPYTPVSSRHKVGSFSLLVKKYPKGAMGAEFQKLKSGDSMLFWQIPFNKKIQYPFGSPNTILMLAAGTGITPMYQALSRIFEGDDEPDSVGKTTNGKGTKVILLYASHSEKDIYLKKEMDHLQKQFPDRLDVIHIVSTNATNKKMKNDIAGTEATLSSSRSTFLLGSETSSSLMEFGRIDKQTIEKIFKSMASRDESEGKVPKPKREKLQVWICGPPSFYNFLCGPREDKIISGVLKELGFSSNQIIKF